MYGGMDPYAPKLLMPKMLHGFQQSTKGPSELGGCMCKYSRCWKQYTRCSATLARNFSRCA